MTNFSRETSACFHNQCVLCTIPSKRSRENATAAWVVDVAIDRATATDGVVSVSELAGVVRELSEDYQVQQLQGSIAGAAILGLAGDCDSKQFELSELVKEITNGKDF